MMILYDSPNLTIEFKNVPCRFLMTRWAGSTPGDEYQQGVTTILKCCYDNNVSKLVSDIRSQEVISESELRRADAAIQEHSDRHGQFYQAVLLSTDVFIRFHSGDFDTAGRKHVKQFFSNEEEALAWLYEVDLQV